MKKFFLCLMMTLLLTVPAAAATNAKVELLQLSESLYSTSQVQDSEDNIESKCLNVFYNSKTADKGVITSTQDCVVAGIDLVGNDSTNKELSLKYTVNGQEIIIKIRQNYASDLKVGQPITAGDVIGVFDKHVTKGAGLICISAFKGNDALETSEYVKTL